MNYNHDLFIEKLSEIDSKEVQYQMLRKYMLGLPNEEFDKFLFGNLDKIQHGVVELGERGNWAKEDKQDFAKTINNLITITQSLQKNAVVALK